MTEKNSRGEELGHTDPVRRLVWSRKSGAFVGQEEATVERQKSKRSLFIKGPLPLWWLQKASMLTGCSLAVALYLWFQRGFGHEEVKVSSTHMRRWGVGKKGLRSALLSLEGAGLVAVKRAPGSAARVRVLCVDNWDR